MTESRIQHNLIMWFGQTWPEYRELLFMVHNETENFKQLMYRKSMGQIPGVSDLVFMVPGTGKLAGIELKAPDSTHLSEHINRQLAWGEKIIENNGFYLMTSDLKDAKNFIKSLIEKTSEHLIYQIGSLNYIRSQLNKKTIKF